MLWQDFNICPSLCHPFLFQFRNALLKSSVLTFSFLSSKNFHFHPCWHSALSPRVPISWGVGPRPKTRTRPLGSFAPQTAAYASPSWIVLSFNSGWASTMALISSYKIWISKVYTTDPCFFIWGKLTIVPAASLKGTPFFLVCVLMYTSSLRGGRPSALPYKFITMYQWKCPKIIYRMSNMIGLCTIL